MRLIFAGSPEFARVVLADLLNSEHQIVAVLTQKDKQAGRGRKIKISPVKEIALKHGLPVFQPQYLGDDPLISQLDSYNADAMIVVSYGKILPLNVLELFELGCLNIHVSILPRWRGAAPIHRAIEAGDTQTGVSIMQMDSKLDTGAVRLLEKVAIDANETTATLHNKLACMSAPCLLKVLANPDKYPPVKQQIHGTTYAEKVNSSEAQLDFNQSAAVLERKIRAFNPAPGCWSMMNGVRYKIYGAKVVQAALSIGEIQKSNKKLIIGCGKDALSIEHLQPANRKLITVTEFLNGNPDLPTCVDS